MGIRVRDFLRILSGHKPDAIAEIEVDGKRIPIKSVWQDTEGNLITISDKERLKDDN